MAALNFKKIEQLLSDYLDFKYNEVNNKLYVNKKLDKEVTVLDDYKLNTLLRLIRVGNEHKIQKKDLIEILNSTFVPMFNPFEEYFNKLSQWKEGDTDYIQELANTITVDESVREFWNRSFKKWLVATVACALDPKVTNHQVLTFSGAQGLGKTTWMKNLVPEALSEYYYGGSINPGNKDTEIHLAENFLINLDELDNLGRKNMNALKEIITKPSIKVRRPYASAAETMPRRASFMGSINNLEFLTDQTGSRRFLCFEVLAISYNHGIDLDKVYAQAVSLFKSGFKYWMDGKDNEEIESHNKAFQVVPLEQEILERYYRPCVGNEEPDMELETEDLILKLSEKSKIASRLSARNLGSVLNRTNWTKRKTKGRRYWLLKEVK